MKSGSMNIGASFQTSVVGDVEYQLSRCFMNYAKDQLINKEYSIMIQSNKLLEKLTTKLSQKQLSFSDKQYCNPTSSSTLDSLITQQDEQIPRLRNRPFARRTANNQQRVINNDFNINLALEEVRENCSAKTYSTVNLLIQNYHKAKKSALNQSKAQLNVSVTAMGRHKPDTDRSNCDQAIILTARNLKLQKQNACLVQKQRQLELSMNQLSQRLSELLENSQSHIQKYLAEKQKNLLSKQQKMQKIHQDIIKNLQNTFQAQNGCNRCIILKKIKDSLIKYKVCLEEDIAGYRTMWMELLKQQRETVKSKCQKDGKTVKIVREKEVDKGQQNVRKQGEL